MAFLQPPKGVSVQQLLAEPTTSSADIAEKQGKSVLVCFTCAGRGIILCIQGVFKAKLSCHECNGEGVTKEKT